MIDFGLSAYAREGEEEGLSDVVGTAYYMAPEVLRGSYGHKADVWSCGVVLYLMLSGMPPFRGADERAVFHSIIHDEPDFKGPAWRHVSSAAKEAIAAMLRKDPRKRPNASELLREFEWLEEASRDDKRERRATTSDAGVVAAGAAATAASTAAASTASALAAFRKKTKPQPPLKGEEHAPSASPTPPLPSPPPSSSSSSPWKEPSAPLDPAVKESLRRFVGTDRLKRQATLLVAGRLRGGAAQMAALRAACATLDADGRGVISVDQLRDAITCVAAHASGDHGASCAVVEAKRAAAAAGAGGAEEAPKPETALSPSSSSNKLCSSEAGGEEGGEEDASCGCSLSSSTCDLLQLEQHHLLSSRPASAAVSEGAGLDSGGDGIRDQRHRHLKHDCCSELGALLLDVCEEFREGCRLDYNKFVDYALQSSAKVK